MVVVDVVVAVVVVGVGHHEAGDVEDAEQESDQLEGVHEAVAYENLWEISFLSFCKTCVIEPTFKTNANKLIMFFIISHYRMAYYIFDF